MNSETRIPNGLFFEESFLESRPSSFLRHSAFVIQDSSGPWDSAEKSRTVEQCVGVCKEQRMTRIHVRRHGLPIRIHLQTRLQCEWRRVARGDFETNVVVVRRPRTTQHERTG